MLLAPSSEAADGASLTTVIEQQRFDGTLILDGEGRITEFDAAAERMLGCTRDEAVGRDLAELALSAPLRSGFRAALRQLFVADESDSVRVEMTATRAEGLEFPVELTLNPIHRAGPPLFAGLIRDIAARKQVEAALAERAAEAAFTADVGVALTENNTLQGSLQRCAEAVVQHLGAAFARIWTLNEKEQVLELLASAGLYTHIDGPHARVPVGKFKIGLIAQERQPHLTNSVLR